MYCVISIWNVDINKQRIIYLFIGSLLCPIKFQTLKGAKSAA